MKRTILVQGAGSGGGNNVIHSLRKSEMETRILGSNCLHHSVLKSTADQTFLLPESSKPDYLSALQDLIVKEKIDMVVPQSDREVNAVSLNRDQLNCRVFLPEHDIVETCQDKHSMFLKLNKANVKTASAVPLETLDDVDKAFEALPDSPKYWVRLRKGSGSKGATWVKTPRQAKAWIELWVDLRGQKISDFHILPFLPGRDYAFQSVWKNGELVVAKMCERLEYFMGSLRLSGMSSTPEIARTLRDDQALETIFKAINTVADKPNGNFNLDLKADADGAMNVTEFNVGRFCMITPIFDRTGVANTVEAHVRCAFDEDFKIKEPIDIAEDYYLIRELDTEPLVIHKSEWDKLTETSQRSL